MVSFLFDVHPDPWGKHPIWRAYFSRWVGSKPAPQIPRQKWQQILVERPLIDEIPNVQPSYLTNCFFLCCFGCLSGHLAWKDPKSSKILHSSPSLSFGGIWYQKKKQYLIAYNAPAIYKRLKILKQPGRKILISRKTSKLTWLQIDETPRNQLLKWSSSSIWHRFKIASGFDRHGCMLGHDLAICADISI